MKIRAFFLRVKNYLGTRYCRKRRFKSKELLHSNKINNHPVDFSPSKFHQAIASKLRPSLEFDGGDVVGWQGEARIQLMTLLGPLDRPSSIKEERLWVAEDDRACYEKSHLLTGEGNVIPIYKCVPKASEPPYSWVVCLQGHTSGMHVSIGVDRKNEKFTEVQEGGRNFADWCIDNGMAALCLEQFCFGDREEQSLDRRSPHPCHDAAMHALILGRTLMAERIRDVAVGIEFLRKTQTEGIKNLGLMGNSLGGSVCLYTAAVMEDYVDFVIAGSCVSSIDRSLLTIYHCADLYIPKFRQFFDLGDIMGLIAPRPLIVVQGKEDPIFPFDGLKDAMQRADRCYSALNSESNLHLFLGEGGHRFYPDLATQGLDKLRRSGVLN